MAQKAEQAAGEILTFARKAPPPEKGKEGLPGLGNAPGMPPREVPPFPSSPILQAPVGPPLNLLPQKLVLAAFPGCPKRLTHGLGSLQLAQQAEPRLQRRRVTGLEDGKEAATQAPGRMQSP